MSGKKQLQSIDSMVLKRIKAHPPGWVFTPDLFLDLGSRVAIDHTLSRHAQSGSIRRLSRGLYDRPRIHPELGTLYPSVDAVANALAQRNAIRLQPSGAYAANLLGLTEQVPMKIVFLTEGASRSFKINNQEIQLKHTSSRNMATAAKTSGLVIQALRYIGKDHVNDATLKILRSRLKDKDKKDLLKDIRYAPAWIANIMKQVAQDGRQ